MLARRGTDSAELVQSLPQLSRSPLGGRSKMSISSKDPLARIISVMAIAIAFATFFLNYFYVSHDVKAVVIQMECFFDRLSTSVAVVNNGSRQALIIDVAAQLIINTPEGRWTIATVNKSPDLPTVVEPGKTILVRLDGPISLNRSLSISTDLDSIKDSITIFAHVLIRSTDDRGIQFAAVSPLAKVTISHGQLTTEVDSKRFDLFDHETTVTTGMGQFSK